MKILRPPLFMRPDPEAELEQIIDRALRRLPDRQAPANLMPRVLQALAQRRNLPWWRKAYTFWPWPARFLFLATTCGLSALVLYFTWGMSAGLSFASLSNEVSEITARFDAFGGIARALGGAAVTLVRSAGPWVCWVGAGLLAACYLTTMALGTFCYRLACPRSS